MGSRANVAMGKRSERDSGIRTNRGETLGRRDDIAVVLGKKRRSKGIEGGGKNMGRRGYIARDVGKNGWELSIDVRKKGGSGDGNGCANIGKIVYFGI
jgi:hypothetical protein